MKESKINHQVFPTFDINRTIIFVEREYAESLKSSLISKNFNIPGDLEEKTSKHTEFAKKIGKDIILEDYLAIVVEDTIEKVKDPADKLMIQIMEKI